MYEVKPISFDSFEWAVNVAAKNMINQEVKRPELYHRPTIEQLASRMLVDETGFIAYKEGRPVGAIGGILVPNIYNPQIFTLTELLWYVLPDHRQSRLGLLLLKSYKELADERADEATLSTLTASAINQRSLERLGFKLSEFCYLYQK